MDDNNNTTDLINRKMYKAFLEIIKEDLAPGLEKKVILIDYCPPQWQEQLIQFISTLWGLPYEQFPLSQVKNLHLMQQIFDPSRRTITILDATDLSDRALIQENLKYFLMLFRNKVAVVLGTGELDSMIIPNSLGIEVKIQVDQVLQTHIYPDTNYPPIDLQDDQELLTHAVKVIPKYRLQDVKLPPKFAANISCIVTDLKTKHHTEYKLKYRKKYPRDNGVSMVFHGKSGTGKTMTAEAIAHELGVPLYVIDLSQVFQEQNHETAKTLEAIFRAAYGVQGILLFNNGDAVFSKGPLEEWTTEPYANMETYILLNKMKNFDGISIVTTQLDESMLTAFRQRLSFVEKFPSVGDPNLIGTLWQPITLPKINLKMKFENRI